MTKGFLRFLRRNTIALLALFLALGGTTYAASSALIARNSVASPQVVNGSLQTKDLSAKARKALKGNRGLRGVPGAPGANGVQGPKGATGAQGPVGPDLEELRAQRDLTPGGTDLTGAPSGRVQVNTVAITAPSAGFLIISGHAFVNNDSGATSYVIVPKLDGTAVNATGWGSTLFAGADTTATERFELSYTTTVPVAAGAHTVTQDLGPFGGTSLFFYNNNELTVLFVPNGGVT
jgi:hypothetical protein